jgi:hypothetical protein
MPKLLLGWLYIILWSYPSFAQENDSVPLIVPVNEYFLKLSPLSFIEADGGLSISGEYVLSKSRLGLQLELQPILFNIYNNRRSNGDGIEMPDNVRASGMPLGIELRPEVRYYLEGVRSRPYRPHVVTRPDGTKVYRKPEARAYVALNFLFKRTRTERLGDVTISDGGTQPAYRQVATYKDIKQVWGLDLRLGSVFPLSRQGLWFLEPYLGIGLRYKKFRYKGLPVGASKPQRPFIGITEWSSNPDDPDSWRAGFSLPAGLRVSYRLP